MKMEIGYPLIVAVIIAINELLKKVGVPKKFIPIASMALGLLGAVFIVPSANLQQTILFGLVMGLSANGLFDLTKVTKKEDVAEPEA